MANETFETVIGGLEIVILGDVAETAILFSTGDTELELGVTL